jgi:DNA repair protein RadC
MFTSTDLRTDRQVIAAILGEKDANALFAVFPTVSAIRRAGYDGMTLNGIPAKIAHRAAAIIEFSRRADMQDTAPVDPITGAASMARHFQARLNDLQVEEFHVAYLNRANVVMAIEKTSQGGITGTVADPRTILRRALSHNAVSMILCHNHPSGSLKPSRADEELTIKIREAARYFDIRLLDHIIVGGQGTGYYSFADEGLI